MNRTKRVFRRYQWPVFFLIVAVSIASVYAWMDISQTVPASPPIQAQAATTSSLCLTGGTSLTWGNTTATSTSLLPPSGPAVLYCSGGPAFTVTKAGSDTPTFALPGPATSLGYASSPGGCSSPVNISTGIGLTFPTTGTFYYCVDYTPQTTPGSTISQFSISWAS
ncbi:MAG TPA: hypothetical protein VFV92_07880 [Candidatus Bathyarchaeia archaeon]|nr:hypothetical protein [Candidatus Bathyarchaeia archaeon]